MDNKEDILDALNQYENKPTKEIPPLLEDFLRQVAKTGETLFPWTRLKRLFVNKLDQTMQQFHEDFPFDHLQPYPNVENCKFDELRNRVLEAFERFSCAPFTVQRLCELVTEPRKHYKRSDKFLRGIEKNVLVVSTVDPWGRKIVSEHPRAMLNGLDSNGYNGSKLDMSEGQTYVKPDDQFNVSNNNATIWPIGQQPDDHTNTLLPSQQGEPSLFSDETLTTKHQQPVEDSKSDTEAAVEGVGVSSDEAGLDSVPGTLKDRLVEPEVPGSAEDTQSGASTPESDTRSDDDSSVSGPLSETSETSQGAEYGSDNASSEVGSDSPESQTTGAETQATTDSPDENSSTGVTDSSESLQTTSVTEENMQQGSEEVNLGETENSTGFVTTSEETVDEDQKQQGEESNDSQEVTSVSESSSVKESTTRPDTEADTSKNDSRLSDPDTDTANWTRLEGESISVSEAIEDSAEKGSQQSVTSSDSVPSEQTLQSSSESEPVSQSEESKEQGETTVDQCDQTESEVASSTATQSEVATSTATQSEVATSTAQPETSTTEEDTSSAEIDSCSSSSEPTCQTSQTANTEKSTESMEVDSEKVGENEEVSTSQTSASESFEEPMDQE